MKIAIDFDGVIVKRKGIPTTGSFWGCKPVKGALASIELLINSGHELYICTNRNKKGFENIGVWLLSNNFPKLKITNRKLANTTIYLDDRAVRFTNWNDFRKLII